MSWIRRSLLVRSVFGSIAIGFAELIVVGMSQPGHALGADDQGARTPILVELFTSEGCSSCPPADVLLQAIDREQPVPGARVIVLSEHVDYWNYEGWRDPFSSSEATRRQETYSARFSQDSPYTPEAVVDGAKGMNGSDRRALFSAIAQAAQGPKLQIEITGAGVSGRLVAAEVKAAAHPHADLYAVLADDHDESSVSQGENSGRHLEHVAVLRSIQKVGSLDTGFETPIRVELPHGSAAKMRLVVFAEERATGHVIGVAETGVAEPRL
jgi:hypothetical protein